MSAAIETHDLTRSFPTGLALDGLTLEVQPGEVLALLGPNGAGKTTTVRLLNGILTPDRGRASVLGLDPTTQGDEVRRRTGVLTEHAGLDERLTARENLVLTGRMRGLDRRWVGQRTDELLERFGMADRADLPVQGTSTGQRKRLALARALLHDPDVLFLDEPTSGLDPAATRDVIDLIGVLATEHGRTVVLATHFLGEAGRLANRMAVLHRGVLHAFGRPQDIAADLWRGIDAELDLGGPLDAATADVLRTAAGVAMVAPSTTGALVRVDGREVVPHLVRLLVERGVPVYGANAKPPTLEDVYFAVESRIAAAEGRAVTQLTVDGVDVAARVGAVVNRSVMRAIVAKDLTAVRRSKAVVIPMLAVPTLLMIVMPFAIGLAARGQANPDIGRILSSMPGDLARPILELPAREQLVVLVNGYLLAPLFLIVPLMVSAVLAADAFAGEKERKTLESLLHLPVAERELFYAKLLTAFIPAIAVSWIGFLCFCVVANGVAWPVMHRLFVPTKLWLVMILWVAPAVATLGLAVMVRVSARARTSQEANQLGGAVILPLIFLAVGQSSGLLLVPLPVAILIGGLIWVVAIWLVRGGAKRFTRDQLSARV